MRSILKDIQQQIKSTGLIQKIIDGETSYCDLAEYALHKEISDLQPDTALLAIAMDAKAIAQSIGALSSPAMRILGFECDRILEDYAPLWLENAKTKDVDSDRALELLMSTPEDLESLADLLSLAGDFICDTHDIEASLLTILKVQAASNALIAEEYIAVLTGGMDQDTAPLNLEMAHVPNDNIIHFPVSVRA